MATPPTTRPSYPRMATPPKLMPGQPLSPAQPPNATKYRHSKGNDPSGLVFVIGLVALMASHIIWPGILLLIGLTNLVHQAARGRPDRGLRALLWLGGITLLIVTKTFWPGILILLFISMALGRGRSRPWYW
jgi:hypothetical protein